MYALDKFKGTTHDVYIWNDMNEPSVFNGPEITMPKDCMHYGGLEHRDIHNEFTLKQVISWNKNGTKYEFHLHGKMNLFWKYVLQVIPTYEGLIERSSHRRPFILSRGHFAGSQRYVAIWTGDNAAEWSHLGASFPMCLSEAIGGISFCGADIGGFFNNPDTELLQRWYQVRTVNIFFCI